MTRADKNQGEENSLDFLRKKLTFLEQKIVQIENADPFSKLLLDYVRSAVDTKILMDKVEAALGEGDAELEKGKRRELLKAFGVALLNKVLEFVPDERKEDAITLASDLGRSYPC